LPFEFFKFFFQQGRPEVLVVRFFDELYAATAPQAEGGSFIGPDGMGGSCGYPKVVKSSSRSYDLVSAQRLWQVSEELTGMKYKVK